jgi:hypothetical protein
MLHDLTPGQGFAIPVLANFEDEKVFVPYELLVPHTLRSCNGEEMPEGAVLGSLSLDRQDLRCNPVALDKIRPRKAPPVVSRAPPVSRLEFSEVQTYPPSLEEFTHFCPGGVCDVVLGSQLLCLCRPASSRREQYGKLSAQCFRIVKGLNAKLISEG